MNAFLNITVTVSSRQAVAEIKAIERALTSVGKIRGQNLNRMFDAMTVAAAKADSKISSTFTRMGSRIGPALSKALVKPIDALNQALARRAPFGPAFQKNLVKVQKGMQAINVQSAKLPNAFGPRFAQGLAKVNSQLAKTVSHVNAMPARNLFGPQFAQGLAQVNAQISKTNAALSSMPVNRFGPQFAAGLAQVNAQIAKTNVGLTSLAQNRFGPQFAANVAKINQQMTGLSSRMGTVGAAARRVFPANWGIGPIARASSMLTGLQVKLAGMGGGAGFTGFSKAVSGIRTAAGSMGAGLSAITKGFGTAFGAVGKFTGAIARMPSHLIRAGKQLQWLGRQLTFNVSLPLGFLAYTITKFNIDIERAMTGVRKVYGDYTFTAKRVKEETDALAISFELLSSRFGVNQVEVIKIAEAWAAAGSAGSGLAENVRATLEMMTLGGLDAQTATEGLIALQATWQLSTKKNKDGTSELTRAMAILNAIENATGVNMGGLIDAFTRAGGAARVSGVDIRHLGAMVAALTPAAGSAANAGNSLKTILSRLSAPVGTVKEGLEQLGINVNDISWTALTATEKVELLAREFGTLDEATQANIASQIGGAYQYNRLITLLDDVRKKDGFYQRALMVTNTVIDKRTGKLRTLATYEKELATVLASNPKKIDIMTNAMKNQLATALLPLVPVIMQMIGLLAKAVTWFAELPQGTRNMILLGAAILFAIGPLMIMMSSFMQLSGVLMKMVIVPLLGVKWALSKLAGGLWGLLKVVFQVIGGMAGLLRSTVRFIFRAFIPAVWAGVRTLMMGLASMVSSFAAAVGLPVWVVIAIIVAAIATLLFIFNEGFRNQVIKIMDSVAQAFLRLPTALQMVIRGMLMVFGPLPGIMLNLMMSTFRDPVWAAVQAVANGLAQLPGIFVDVFNAVIRILTQVITQITEFLSYLNPFARHSPSLVENVKAGVSAIMFEYQKLTGIGAILASAQRALASFNEAAGPDIRKFRKVELTDQARQVREVNPDLGGAADRMVAIILKLEARLPALTAKLEAQQKVVDKWSEALERANIKLEAWQSKLADSEKALETVTEKIDAAKARIDELANTPIQGMQRFEDQLFRNEHAQNKLNLRMLQFEKQGLTLDKITEKYAAMNGELEMLRGEQNRLRMLGAGSDILGSYEDQIDAVEREQRGLERTERTLRNLQEQLDALDLENRILQLKKAIKFDPLLRQLDQMTNKVEEMPFDEIVRQIRQQQRIIKRLTPDQERLTRKVERERDVVEDLTEKRDAIQAQLDKEQRKLDQIQSTYDKITGAIEDMERAMSGFLDLAKKAADIAAGVEVPEGPEVEEPFPGGRYKIPKGTGALKPEGLLKDIREFNRKLNRELQDALEGMSDMDMLAPIKEKWEEVQEWFRGKRDSFVGFFRRMWEKIKEIFSKGLTKVKDILGPIWEKIKTAAEKAWGVIQDVIDAAWKVIEPIFGLMIAGVKLVIEVFKLVVGVVRWVWQKYVGPIISKVWNNVIKPVFRAIRTFIQDRLLPIFRRIRDVVVAVWRRVGAKIKEAWHRIIKPALREVRQFINEKLLPAFRKIRDQVIPIFRRIGRIIKWVWNRVIKPAFREIREFIEKRLIPPFQLLWAVVKIVFVLIGRIIRGVWNKVIKPTWEAIKGKLAMLKRNFEDFRKKVKEVWDFIKEKITMVWRNHIKPRLEDIRDAIGWTIDKFQKLWEKVKAVWGWITEKTRKAWYTYIKPVFDKVVAYIEFKLGPKFEALQTIVEKVFGAIVKVIGTAWNTIGNGIEGFFNFFIDMFNAIAGVVRSIAGFLNIEVDIKDMTHIDPFPEAPEEMDFYARGGTIGRNGGRVAGARAVVGEGSDIYPEFVIPTDPQYRKRALALLADAQSRINTGPVSLLQRVGALPQDERARQGHIGGWGPIGWAKDQATKMWEGAKDRVTDIGKFVGKKVIQGMWYPARAVATTAIEKIPEGNFIRKAGTGLIGTIDEWVNQLDQEIKKTTADLRTGYRTDPRLGASGSWQVAEKALNDWNIPHKIISTYRPGSRTRFSGSLSYHAQNRAADITGPVWSDQPNPEMDRITTFLGHVFGPAIKELIYGGNVTNYYNGVPHVFDPFLQQEHMNHVHIALAKGGSFTVPRRPGGINVNLGEGMYNEKIQVIPLGPGDAGGNGGATVNIYGDLSFPNIQDGDDAYEFVQNLKALAQ